MFTEIRTSNLIINCLLIALISLACVYQLHEKTIALSLQKALYLMIASLMFLILCVTIWKIRLFSEELYYIKMDYNNDFLFLIESLNFNISSWIVIIITFILFMMFGFTSNLNLIQIIQFNISSALLSLVFSMALLNSINIFECRMTKVTAVFSSGGLDAGTAMAGSYFYGYLKIMLPASGGLERGGMFSALEKYEASEKVKISVKKLFILIPASSYIPPDLREISDNWLMPAKSLETIAIDRAGVKNRTYHNTIYKLYANGPDSEERIYLATEGATPLKTFSEVQDKSHRYAPVYREFNKEVVRNFYTTLQNLLNDNPDCKDYCELVYYEDIVDGKRVNPAKVLLERVKKNKES